MRSPTPKTTRPSSKSQKPAGEDGDGLTQSERFIKAAQELGTDDDPERFAERVKKLAKRLPIDKSKI